MEFGAGAAPSRVDWCCHQSASHPPATFHQSGPNIFCHQCQQPGDGFLVEQVLQNTQFACRAKRRPMQTRRPEQRKTKEIVISFKLAHYTVHMPFRKVHLRGFLRMHNFQVICALPVAVTPYKTMSSAFVYVMDLLGST